MAALSQRLSFAGRLAVVTGGSLGIGRAVVLRLLEQGAHVVTCARSAAPLAELADAAAAVDDGGAQHRLLCLGGVDVADAAARAELIESSKAFAEESGAQLNCLVNNVGTNIRKPTAEYDLSEFSHLLRTNLESAFHLTQLALPSLTQSDRSAVVHVSSVSGGPTCTQTGSVYAATKAAMNHMTRYTACEWASLGVRVNAVAPWYIRTPLAEAVLANDEYSKWVLDRTPAHRIGEVGEVADAVAFLASDAASYISGTVLAVDGGFSSSGFGFFPGFAIPSASPGA